MYTIVFSFLSPVNIKSSAKADAFFGSIYNFIDGASLGQYGESEPLTHSFGDGIDEACKLWKKNIFWADQKHNATGAVLHGSPRRHANVSFYYDSAEVVADSLSGLLKNVSGLFEVDYSVVHIIQKRSRTEEDEILEGVTSHHLQACLPSVSWASCFGKPYLHMIGVEKFNAAPFDVVDMVSDELVYCQLTRDPKDYCSSYDFFKNQQEAVKTCLGEQYFLGSDKPISPEFVFAP